MVLFLFTRLFSPLPLSLRAVAPHLSQLGKPVVRSAEAPGKGSAAVVADELVGLFGIVDSDADREGGAQELERQGAAVVGTPLELEDRDELADVVSIDSLSTYLQGVTGTRQQSGTSVSRALTR